jgi:hypothetical protein
MQDKISIIDAGLACEDGVPSYFEIEYAQGGALGTARISLGTCFELLNQGRWERYGDEEIRLEIQVWNTLGGYMERRVNAMPLRDWVERRLFDQGFFSAARQIISQLNINNHENTIHEVL